MLIRLLWPADANGMTGNRSSERNQRGRTTRQNDLQEEPAVPFKDTIQLESRLRDKSGRRCGRRGGGGRRRRSLRLGGSRKGIFTDVRPRLHDTACWWDFSRLVAATGEARRPTDPMGQDATRRQSRSRLRRRGKRRGEEIRFFSIVSGIAAWML